MAETTGRAIIRISALPDSALRRALTGTVDAARKANKLVASESAKAAKQAEQVKARSDRAVAQSSHRAAAEMIRDAKRVEEAKKRSAEQVLRAAERSAAGERREAQKTARTQIREAEKAAQAQARILQKSTEQRRRLLLAVGAGAFGAAKGGAALAGRGQGLAGVGSLEERLNTSGDFQQQMIRTAGEAKLAPAERAKVEENLLKISEATNVSILDLVAGLTAAQSRFDQFREFSVTIGDVAKVSQATGSSLEDLVGAIGTATQVFQLDTAGQAEFINALVATSERGAIDVKSMASDLAGTMGSFQNATGRTGIGAAREFLATSQVMGTSQVGAAETATMIERFTSALAMPDTQAKLKKIGVNVIDKETGQPRNIGDIGAELAANKRFDEKGVRAAIFPELRAMKGAEFLTAELKRDPEAFKGLQNIDAGEGAASVEKRMAELSENPMFKLQNVGVRAQAETVRDADRLVKAITPAVTELTRLQTKFPLLTESMGTLESSVRWAVGALVANKLMGGGAAFGAEAGAALGKTASVSLGKAFSDAGWAGKVGMAGQLMATGFLAFMTTQQILALTGWDKAIEGWGQDLYDALHGKTPRSQTRGMGGTGKGGATGGWDDVPRAPGTTPGASGDWEQPVPGFSMLPPEHVIQTPLRPVQDMTADELRDSVRPVPPTPEGKLVIEVKGSAVVKSVSFEGTWDAVLNKVRSASNTGRRDVTPP